MIERSGRMTGHPEVGGFQSARPQCPVNYLGISGGRIRANNMGAVFHP